MSNIISFSTIAMATLLGTGSLAMAISGAARAETAPRLSEPVSHANLSAYFLRGTSAAGPVPLTLAEALAKGVVTVHETGKVNQLDVENRGDEDVFIQAGDIVKGGQQDRVLTVSLLLSAGMGRMPIGAFCVEQGRWSARGSEDAKRFASADKAVPSREAKLAMMAPGKPMQSEAAAGSGASHSQPLRQQARGLGQSEMAARQSEVWATVGKIQEKLTTNLKAKIASGQSASSLQLSLENDALATAKAEYVKALQSAADADDDIVGVVFAINGRISSAEVYPSNGLFRKMWPKLVDAGATEAIGEKDDPAAATPTVGVVAAFLASADAGKAEPPVPLAAGLDRQTIDGDRSVAVATRRSDGREIHRTYLAK